MPNGHIIYTPFFRFPVQYWFAKKISSESEWKRINDAVAKMRSISRRGRSPKLSDDSKNSILKKAAETTKTNHPMTVQDITLSDLFLYCLSSFFSSFLGKRFVFGLTESRWRFITSHHIEMGLSAPTLASLVSAPIAPFLAHLNATPLCPTTKSLKPHTCLPP